MPIDQLARIELCALTLRTRFVPTKAVVRLASIKLFACLMPMKQVRIQRTLRTLVEWNSAR